MLNLIKLNYLIFILRQLLKIYSHATGINFQNEIRFHRRKTARTVSELFLYMHHESKTKTRITVVRQIFPHYFQRNNFSI